MNEVQSKHHKLLVSVHATMACGVVFGGGGGGGWGRGGMTSVTSALGGVKWSVSSPGHFTPGERSPRYQLNKMLYGPQHRSGRFGQGQLHVTINMSSTNNNF